MPSTAPILTAETILTTAIATALGPLVGTYNSKPKVYYQMAEQGAPLPYVVFQCQADISRLDWLGDVGATVLVTVKAMATSGQAARALLQTVSAGMATLTYAGYTLIARYVQSPAIPPSDGVWQAAHLYRITIERN